MYLDWVLTIVAILIIVFLLYAIYHLVQPNPEGFIVVQTPQQQYSIPELKAVTGRYIRIRPSLNPAADGYLTISQIQVIDINGTNVAFKKGVIATASSFGGSDIDRAYGKLVEVGDIYMLAPGESEGPECVIDGVTFPRNGLTNVFETRNQNSGPEDSATDTEYLEIDLGSNMLITSVIYTGRGDAETRDIVTIDGWKVQLTQVKRNKDIRLEIWNASRVRTYKGLFPCDNPELDKVQTVKIPDTMYGVNLKSSGVFEVKDTINIPNVESFRAFAQPFLNYKLPPTREEDLGASPIVLANAPMIKNIHKIYSSTSIDISNNIFLPILADSPVTFYYDLYAQSGCGKICAQDTNGVKKCTAADPPPYPYCKPNQVTLPGITETLSIEILGRASQEALNEMRDSISYCRLLYLGSPPAIENFVRIHFSTDQTNPIAMKAFLRKDTTTANLPSSATATSALNAQAPPERFCVPDVIQTFRNGQFVTTFSIQNQAWNQAHCTREITCDVLGLIPFASRNFLVSWIANRVVRYKRFVNSLLSNLSAAREELNAANAGVARAEAEQAAAADPRNFTPTENAIVSGSVLVAGLSIATGNPFFALGAAGMIGGISAVKSVIEQFKINKAKIAQAEVQAMYNSVINAGANVNNRVVLSEVSIPLIIPVYIDISSKNALNSLAQQFYEFLGGQFNITYIYDVLPLGSTMLDIRFDLVIHDDMSEISGPINDLKAQYKRIQTATTVSKDILDQSTADYEKELSTLEETSIQSVSNPFKGAVARIFYTGGVKPGNSLCTKGRISSNIRITGMIFDDRAVTSFIPELNGGIPVALGANPGNINFQPTIKYTKNETESLDCRNSDILRRIFNDYIQLVSNVANKYPLLTATPPLDVKKGILFINTVIGASQLTPKSCTLTWTESLYDTTTNIPINPLGGSGGTVAPITRSATFTYTADDSTWYNSELTLSLGGLKLLSASEATAANIMPFNPPLVFTKPLPVRASLENLSNVCPKASCEDVDVLYSLVDQYNSDPTLPGTIMTVTHAFTPNPNQCDVKVSINYDSTIQDIKGDDIRDPVTGITKTVYKTIKKGTVTYDSVGGNLTQGSKSMPYSGIKDNVTLALYTAPDPSTCIYNLANAGVEGSGTSIQSNTPALFTPMIYTNELIKRNEKQLGSSINKIQTDFTQVLGSTKDTLKAYRVDTYRAYGNIYSKNGLGGLCSAKCNDVSIQTMMKDYYNKQLVPGVQIKTFLNIAQTEPTVCEATFNTDATDTPFSYKFFFDTTGSTLSSGAAPNVQQTPVCRITNAKQISITSPTDEQILDIKKEMSAVITESFTSNRQPSPASIVESEALDVRGFGKDLVRNFMSGIKDTQYELPLKQQEPERELRDAPPSYKFLRFTPTATRGAAGPVNVGKFTFFYQGRPLLLNGSVTNPMGTWEGNMADVTGTAGTSGWSDAHKKPLVFAFRYPIAVDAYSFTTAVPEAGIEGDPVSWRLEGSHNGTFWTVVDSQQNFPTPVRRFTELEKIYLNRS